jgi:hypothetical protein
MMTFTRPADIIFGNYELNRRWYDTSGGCAVQSATATKFRDNSHECCGGDDDNTFDSDDY